MLKRQRKYLNGLFVYVLCERQTDHVGVRDDSDTQAFTATCLFWNSGVRRVVLEGYD